MLQTQNKHLKNDIRPIVNHRERHWVVVGGYMVASENFNLIFIDGAQDKCDQELSLQEICKEVQKN